MKNNIRKQKIYEIKNIDEDIYSKIKIMELSTNVIKVIAILIGALGFNHVLKFIEALINKNNDVLLREIIDGILGLALCAGDTCAYIKAQDKTDSIIEKTYEKLIEKE